MLETERSQRVGKEQGDLCSLHAYLERYGQ